VPAPAAGRRKGTNLRKLPLRRKLDAVNRLDQLVIALLQFLIFWDIERGKEKGFYRSVKIIACLGTAVFLESLQPFSKIFAGIVENLVYGVLVIGNLGRTGIPIRCSAVDLASHNEI